MLADADGGEMAMQGFDKADQGSDAPTEALFFDGFLHTCARGFGPDDVEEGVCHVGGGCRSGVLAEVVVKVVEGRSWGFSVGFEEG